MDRQPDASHQHTDELDGSRGWSVVAAAFFALLIVFGVQYSFGAFFDAMAEEFDTGRGSTALVFSLTTFMLFMLGIVTGPLADRYGPRPLLAASAVSMALGLALTATVQSIWMGYITYGIGVGTGVACAYVPIVAAVGGWFERRRATALGVAVAGIGLGTLVGAPSAAALIDWRGFRETYVIFAVISFIGLAACAVVAKRPPGQSAGAEHEPDPRVRETLTHPIFVRLYLTSLGLSGAIFVPFVFIAPYAKDRDIGSVAAAVLVGLIGGASVIGRMGLGAMGARVSLVRLYRWCYLAIGLSLGLWLIAGSSYPVLVLFTVVFGTAYGGWIALSPAVAALFFGARRLGSVLGWLYSGAGIGGLVGPPILGAAIDISDTYAAAIIGAGVLALLSFVFLLPLREPTAAIAVQSSAPDAESEPEAARP